MLSCDVFFLHNPSIMRRFHDFWWDFLSFFNFEEINKIDVEMMRESTSVSAAAAVDDDDDDGRMKRRSQCLLLCLFLWMH